VHAHADALQDLERCLEDLLALLRIEGLQAEALWQSVVGVHGCR
jgi:hypothetical protein